MRWTVSESSSLLSWGETGKPGSSALLLQTPAAGAAAIVGLLFSQSDYSSLPLVKAVSLPLTPEFTRAGRNGLLALGTAIALRNGLDQVYVEGSVIQQAGGTARDLANDFEAWKAGMLTAPGANVAPQVRHDIPSDIANAGQSLGLLMMRNGSVFATTKVPRPGQPVDGFRVAAAVRDLAAGKYAQMPFVTWAKGQLDKLDVEAARAALSAVSSPSPKAVSWYGDKAHPSHGDRLQAAGVSPVLAGIIAETSALSDAVDRRISIQPILSERTGLSKGALKRLSKIRRPLPAGVIFEDRAVGRDALQVERVRRLSLKGRLGEDRACRILAELPPDWTPQTDEAWKAFHEVTSGAAIPLDEVAGIPTKQTLGASKGGWEGFRATLARAADMPIESFGRREIALTTSDAIEVVDELARHIILPLVLSSIASTGQPETTPLDNDMANARLCAFDLVAGGAKSPATALFETARRWMSRIPALVELTGTAADQAAAAAQNGPRAFEQYGEGVFPRFCEDFVASNGYVLRSLNRRELLTEESRRLGHCVGSMYQSKALNGLCYIVSVQNAAGDQSYSTIEIAPVAQGQRVLTETQHRALRNVKPSPQAELAAREFYAAVRTGAHSLNEPEIQRWAQHRAQVEPQTPQAEAVRMSTWRGALGLDPWDENLRDGLWEIWKEILGGDVARADTPEALYRYEGVRNLVDTLSPSAAKILRDRQAARREASGAALAVAGPEL